LGKVREKLLDFKHRLQDRHMYSIVLVVIAAVSIWGIYQYKNAAKLRQELDNKYNRAFYDLTGYVNNVETLLIKSLVASTDSKTATTLQEVWRQANFAQTNLGQLPVSQNILARTSKFLTQVGDFAYSLNNYILSGNRITDEQYNTLEKLYEYAVNLNKGLEELNAQLSTGRIRWKELSEKGPGIFRRTSSEMPTQQFENVDKTFQEYPTLIYDGPFSDHMTKSEPKGLTGEDISAEEGKKKIIQMFGEDKVASVELTGENKSDTIKTFNYTIKFKDSPEDAQASLDLTQKGGHIFWMLYNRPVSEKKIDVDQAKKKGLEFLKQIGIENMKDTYYLSEDNTATINYAYQQDDVIVYPDLIKVKIALDNGEVVGIECKGYLSSHEKREIPEPKISMEEAKSKINPNIEIQSEGMAIIPTNYKTEVFCYEFKGKMKDKDVLVYINAETGQEQEILLIINTPDGILTM